MATSMQKGEYRGHCIGLPGKCRPGAKQQTQTLRGFMLPGIGKTNQEANRQLTFSRRTEIIGESIQLFRLLQERSKRAGGAVGQILGAERRTKQSVTSRCHPK